MFLGIEDHNLQLKHLFRFITGTYTLPPLGFPEQLKVKFVHGCLENCKCRPTASTCELSIHLPVHANTPGGIRELMISAMLEGYGFGKIGSYITQLGGCYTTTTF